MASSRSLDSWVSIDFETANPNRASMCAFGLVAVDRGAVVDSLSGLVRPAPGVSGFSPYNVRVHGITAAAVAGAPTLAEALETILDFVGDRPLVAHNMAFEASVITRTHELLGRPVRPIRRFCTMRLSRGLWPHLDNHRLPTVAASVGHTVVRHHDALADAEAAAHIMVSALRSRDTTDLNAVATHAEHR